jgi:hypothetical protein
MHNYLCYRAKLLTLTHSLLSLLLHNTDSIFYLQSARWQLISDLEQGAYLRERSTPGSGGVEVGHVSLKLTVAPLQGNKHYIHTYILLYTLLLRSTILLSTVLQLSLSHYGYVLSLLIW